MTDRRAGRRARSQAPRPIRSEWATLLNDRKMLSFPGRLPTPADELLVQGFFADPLPRAWRSWVSECGSVAGLGRGLLGLRPRGADGSERDREDALDVLMLLRLTEDAFPGDLLPIELLPDRQLHAVCVGSAERSPVVLVDLDRPELRVDAAKSVTDFVYDWSRDLHAIAAVVEEADRTDDAAETVLLRPDEWSTRRLCSQNVIVGLLQTRHNRDTNEHDVAVFSTAGLTSFAPGAATRWALTTVLTEAHQSGGTLAVNFVRRSRADGALHPDRTERKGAGLPSAVVRWAAAHGVRLDQRDSRWDHETGERLFAAAAPLTDGLRALLPDAAVPVPTVCAAVSTGTWPALDVEIVLRWAQDPARVLTGGAPVSDRLRYVADQHVVRAAVLMSSLARHLRRAGQPSASDEDDTAADLAVAVAEPDPAGPRERTLGQVRFATKGPEPLHLGWPCLAGRRPQGAGLTVRVLPVDAGLLAQIGPALVSVMAAGEALVVPADAAARGHQLGRLFDAAQDAGVAVFAAPDYTTSLDVAIAARLDRSRMSRR